MVRGDTEKIQTFGEWIESRRQDMKMTRAGLAQKVGCAAVTIKKIERDERRPSDQIARLLAEHLGIPSRDREVFLRMARGSLAPSGREVEAALRLPDFLVPEASLPAPVQSRFVQRHRELGRLDGYLQQALNGDGLPVFILGEAGSGKTSLIAEFAAHAQETHPGLLVAAGQCNAQTGPGDPYRPFRDILGMMTGDLDTLRFIGMYNRPQALQLWASIPDTIQAITTAGPRLFNTLLPTEYLVDRLAPYLVREADWFDRLQALVGTQLSAPANLELEPFLDEVTQFLRLIARKYPLLLVLDDLQWVDDASLNLLSHLGRRLAGSRILLLGAFRTGEALSDQSLGGPDSVKMRRLDALIREQARYHGDIQINLDQAVSSEGQAFVQAIVDLEPNRLGNAFREALFQHTKGNPLFTVEILHSMRENQNLVQDDTGCWVENPSSTPPALPARVEAVIAQRLGRLMPSQRDLLNLASVEGESFTAQLLARILKLEPGSAVQTLSQDLGKKFGLIQELGELRTRSLRMDRFQFRHKLFQEYLYDQLGAAEKVHLHRQVAVELEKLLLEAPGGIPSQEYHPDTVSDNGVVLTNAEDLDAFGPFLLHHFWLGWVWPKAAAYARILGGRARQRYAMREAIAYFEQALQALDRQAGATEVPVFDTLIDWVEAAFKFRPYQEQLERLRRAEEIARKAQDKTRLIHSLHWTANVLLERGLWTQAGPALTECLLLAEELGIEQLSVHPVYFKALMTTFSDPGEAGQWIDRAEVLARKYQDMPIEALAFATHGQVYAQMGQFDQSLQAIESARQVSSRLGSPLTESDVDLLAAWSYLAMGDSQRALELSQKSVTKAIATDNMDCICSGLACIGYASLALGKIPEAVAAFEKGIERSDVSGAIIPKLNGQAGLAMTHFLSGQPEAVEDLEKVIALMNQSQFQVGAANASQMLGACLTRLDAYDRAAIYLDQAVALYRQLHMQPFLAKALLSQADLLDKQGYHAEAEQRRAEANAVQFT